MKKVALILLVFLLATGVAKNLESRVVTIQAGENTAQISEEFTISFLTDAEVKEFENLASAGRNELVAWKNYYSAIEPTITGNKTSLLIAAKKDALGFGHVTIEYYANGVITTAGEAGRMVNKQLNQKRLTFYNAETKTFAIPAKTQLQISINGGKAAAAEPEKYTTVVPKTLFLGPYVDVKTNTVTYLIRGPVSTQDFAVEYQIEKGISEFNLQKILDSVYTFAFTNPITTLLILTVAILAGIYRQQLAALITESFAGEEEIEQPKKRL